MKNELISGSTIAVFVDRPRRFSMPSAVNTRDVMPPEPCWRGSRTTLSCMLVQRQFKSLFSTECGSDRGRARSLWAGPC